MIDALSLNFRLVIVQCDDRMIAVLFLNSESHVLAKLIKTTFHVVKAVNERYCEAFFNLVSVADFCHTTSALPYKCETLILEEGLLNNRIVRARHIVCYQENVTLRR